MKLIRKNFGRGQILALVAFLPILGCAHLSGTARNQNSQSKHVMTESKPGMRLVHVKGPIYVAEDYNYYRENTTIYIGDKGVTVLGATWTPETAQLLTQEIRKVTEKPIITVVDTHYHLDRSGGNAYFKKIGAKIIASEQTYNLMKKVWLHMVSDFHKDYHTDVEVPLVLPEVAFVDHVGERYNLQDGNVQILYLGQSHTSDDVFVYFPHEKVLDGDCILKQYLGWLGDANVEEYPKTLMRLKHLHLPIQIIIAGHWSPIHGPELIDQDLKLLRERQSTKSKR